MAFRPVQNVLVRSAIRQELRRQGYGFLEALQLSQAATDDVISVASQECDPAIKAKLYALGAIGDGTIINAILDFLKSEEGQAFIRFIIMLIIGV